MKKHKSLLTLLIATISTIGLISVTPTAASAAYSFDVISDTHIGPDDDPSPNGAFHPNANLNTTFESIKNNIKNGKYKNEQCIVINGDVVDNSQQSSYNKLYNIVNQQKDGLPYIYFNIGNHEYDANPYVQPNIIEDFHTGLNRFNSNTNNIRKLLSANTKGKVTDTDRDNSYDIQYINNKNDRLLFLGTDEIPTNPCAAYLNPDTQLNWLQGRIQDNTNEGGDSKKPMFIFLHQPLYQTTYGSTFDDWGYLYPNNTTYVKQWLTGHPEIVVFTGHTHEQFKENDEWNSDNFFSLGDNSASIFNVPSIGNDSGKGPQGYHITVYSDGIVVTGVRYTNAGCQIVNTRTVDF
ncbi:MULTISPECIES: metallophosphoesterase [Clostridium]|uniref:Metallophosphoesterase n=1 Tax=Clostridium cibarium TaxID=2762247 RepID=A0ABR8PP59_9CLOT|nr:MULTISPECIES: metallophosphoesterase [Clostridium]MBD7909965.1 metallophosphoesterase [Clostridium cibarium]